jgi:HPt (histidine-containing phosphotransfer) domain-containing protein
MTHFVSKPFDVPSTIALIQRLRRPSALAHAVAPAGAGVIPVSQISLDSSPEKSVMDVAQGLKIWSDARTYRDYLRRFSDSYSNAVDVMKKSLATGDRAGAAALAHKLSGVAANLALPDARRLASVAEQVLGSNGNPTLTLNRLGDAVAAAVAEIERFAPPAPLANDAPSTNGSGSSDLSHEQQAELKTLLIELQAALDTDNPAPVKSVLATLEKQLPQQALAGIWACVRGFDFRGAEASTLRLANEFGIVIGEQ